MVEDCGVADPEQFRILEQGGEAWNRWRTNSRVLNIDLRGADLVRAELQDAILAGADLRGADLREASLMGATLNRADLRGATLDGVKINDARAPFARFDDASLVGAYLWGSDFREASFDRADLTDANLKNTQLVRASFRRACLVRCKVYGAAAWEVVLDEAVQEDLNISPGDSPPILVGDLEVAPFIFLLTNSRALRRIVDTITSKAVLILGGFQPPRKIVLNAIRDDLKRRGYVPILFESDAPQSRDVSETVALLARLARFVIAEISETRSVPKELESIVPHVAIPIQTIIEEGERPYSMFRDYRKYQWVLPPYPYSGLDGLRSALDNHVLAPAESKLRELEAMRMADAEVTWQ